MGKKITDQDYNLIVTISSITFYPVLSQKVSRQQFCCYKWTAKYFN